MLVWLQRAVWITLLFSST